MENIEANPSPNSTAVGPVPGCAHRQLTSCDWTDSCNDRHRFYWQLPDETLQRLRAARTILEDEGFLASDINWGRRILATTPAPYVPIPDVSARWTEPSTIEHYSDAIAAVLQVAVAAGHDPAVVTGVALRTQVSVKRHSESAIRR